MKGKKLLIDFAEEEGLLKALNVYAVNEGLTKKFVVHEALKQYLDNKLEDHLRYKMAENVFAEWNSEDDEIYNKL